jgi:hypothetical protein
MSWRDISLTWLCYQTHDGATILSGVAFTRGPREENRAPPGTFRSFQPIVRECRRTKTAKALSLTVPPSLLARALSK